MKNKLLTILAMGLLAGPMAAQAHTISLGFENAGPGSVTFWAGSYHGCFGGNEGALTLSGANATVYGPTQQFFAGGIVCTKPVSLVDGTNNFYANNRSNPSGNMVATNTTGLPVLIWQGVTFAGLVPGDYQFNFNNLNVTIRFSQWDQSLGSVFTLSGAVVTPGNALPEPGTLALLGLGLVGLGFARRRKLS